MAYRMTKTERIARRNFSRDWYVLDQMLLEDRLQVELPREWHLLEHDMDVQEKKEKVTLYLDRSVARMFRGMGPGYQSVVNRVLRCWMQAKIGEFLRFEDAIRDRRDEVINADHKARRSGDRPALDDRVEDWPEDPSEDLPPEDGA
jgi:hypothetical protein